MSEGRAARIVGLTLAALWLAMSALAAIAGSEDGRDTIAGAAPGEVTASVAPVTE